MLRTAFAIRYVKSRSRSSNTEGQAMHGGWQLLVLIALAGILFDAGCQSSGRGTAASGGPSRTFGLTYVPQQSEPPLDDSSAGSKSIAKQRSDSTGDTGDEKSGNRLARLLSGKEKEPAERRTLPISSRTASAENGDETDE